MEIPRVLFGQRAEVKKRMAPILRAFAGGEPATSLPYGPLMSIEEAPGAIVLFDPGRGSSELNAFHCYAFLYGVMEAVTTGRMPRDHFAKAFGWSLGAAWSFAGALGEAGGAFFLRMPREAFIKDPPAELLDGKPEWYAPFLKAALMHWDAFTASGPRFASGALLQPQEFTQVSRTLAHVLKYCGVVSTRADVATPAKVLAAIQAALAKLED